MARLSNEGNPRATNLRVVGRGIIKATIPANEGGVVAEASHDLGYTPMVFMYLRDEVFNYQQIPAVVDLGSHRDNYRVGTNRTRVWVRIDTTTIVSFDRDQYFYYFLVDNPLNVFDSFLEVE